MATAPDEVRRRERGIMRLPVAAPRRLERTPGWWLASTHRVRHSGSGGWRKRVARTRAGKARAGRWPMPSICVGPFCGTATGLWISRG